MKKENSGIILGMSLGFALVSFIAFAFMVFAYVQKGDGDEKIVKNTVVEQKNSAVNNQIAKPQAPKPTVAKIIDVKVGENDNFRGNKNAPVTIVEFSDPQCPYCARFHETMKQVMTAYPDKVKWVYRHFPLDSIHPYARKTAEALECAGDQEKFWEYADEIYANQSSLSTDYLPLVAKKLALNVSKFQKCLDTGKYADKVSADLKYGQEIGVKGTPGNFINGQSVPGAVPFSQIKSIIDSL